jgi:serine/threonine-protein kinase RsbW
MIHYKQDSVSWDRRRRVAWGRFQLQELAEVPEVCTAVARAMFNLGYPARDLAAVRLALDEAITNAIKHGHRGDPDKRVDVTFVVGAAQVVADVADEGEGFDPRRLPDPRTPEARERTGGRGVFLMRASMTWVRFNARGNRVVLCLHRSA